MSFVKKTLTLFIQITRDVAYMRTILKDYDFDVKTGIKYNDLMTKRSELEKRIKIVLPYPKSAKAWIYYYDYVLSNNLESELKNIDRKQLNNIYTEMTLIKNELFDIYGMTPFINSPDIYRIYTLYRAIIKVNTIIENHYEFCLNKHQNISKEIEEQRQLFIKLRDDIFKLYNVVNEEELLKTNILLVNKKPNEKKINLVHIDENIEILDKIKQNVMTLILENN